MFNCMLLCCDCSHGKYGKDWCTPSLPYKSPVSALDYRKWSLHVETANWLQLMEAVLGKENYGYMEGGTLGVDHVH